MLGNDSVMRSRYLWCTTLFLLCHAQMHTQVLTNTLPAASSSVTDTESQSQQAQPPTPAADIPDDPSLQLLPAARPEPVPKTGLPVRLEAKEQTHAGDVTTLTGEAVFYYKNYVIHADKVVYHQSTSTVEAEGHLQLEGGPNDAIFTASHGEMHLEDHTARFFDVTGTLGVRHMGKTQIFTTPDPFIFTGRVLLQTAEGSYRILDGSMTSCRLPKPDWALVSRSIQVDDGKASTHNSFFKFWQVPLFYLPFVARNLDETGRETGFLIPTGENSSTKGLVIGEEVYWVINRSMDMTIGAEYWSKRGWHPKGDFRYKGQDLDGLTVRWDALLDRGIEETLSGATTPTLVNQGGTDILAYGRKDLSTNTRVAGNVEYLSSYIYRLAFDPNLTQATSSEVQSNVALTQNLRGFIPSLTLDRFQSFAGSASTNGTPVVSVPEVRILHLPSLRFDVPDRPLAFAAGNSPAYWGLGSSIADLSRAEPHFHARNVGRLDLYPHLEWPLHLGDWNILPEVALRTTQYSGHQIPDLLGTHFNGVPFVTHDPLNRSDVEASLDIRPPALERDFTLSRWHRELRHVIEPEIFYRYVTGINNARQVLQFDPTDIATNTNEAGYSLTQRFYLKRLGPQPCVAQPVPEHQPRPSPVPDSSPDSAPAAPDSNTESPHATESPNCAPPPREWASWQITQKFFIDPNFGGALIPNRRNIFDSTLDLTGVAFLTSPRNISPVVSRVRFEAIDRLRIEWDFDYDPKAGRVNSDNVFAGYSFGRTTVGLGHALLNAADESGSTASVIQSQQVQPFIYFGKPSDVGLSLALNARYDFTHDSLQYGGVQAIYNWNCCGLNVGYRKFALGSLRDESEWLWGFTLSSIGTAGNIHSSTAVFPTPDVLSRMY